MGKVFGAYTDISWQNDGYSKSGKGNSFVFSLRDDFNFIKFKCLNKKEEVNHNENYLTYIGSGASGFKIANECNINKRSFSCLGLNR